jgi:DNA-binding MarR family transcriptional regulator
MASRPTAHRTSRVVTLVAKRQPLKLDPAARPGDIVGYLLKSVTHSVRQALDETFRQHGLRVSFAHVPVLYVAKQEPGIPGAQLARRLSVAAQSMHTILKGLERQGYIERKPHPHNRRAETWYVTRAGFKQLDLAHEAAGVVWGRMLKLLSDSETAQLTHLLQRCIEGLDPGGSAFQCGHEEPIRVQRRRSGS